NRLRALRHTRRRRTRFPAIVRVELVEHPHHNAGTGALIPAAVLIARLARPRTAACAIGSADAGAPIGEAAGTAAALTLVMRAVRVAVEGDDPVAGADDQISVPVDRRGRQRRLTAQIHQERGFTIVVIDQPGDGAVEGVMAEAAPGNA